MVKHLKTRLFRGGPREPHLAEENTEENHDSELWLLKKVEGGKARRGSPMYCSLEQN